MRVYKQTRTVRWTQLIIAAVVILSTLSLGAVYLVTRDRTALAAPTQSGAPRVTLNPGGGKLSDGTDGLRFTINADPGNDGFESTLAGQDALLYRGTFQYCCSAGAPMLNVGGTLYGTAGPAYSSANWTSVSVIATSGVASVGARTTNTGNSSAIIRYTAVKGGLTYQVDRTVTYTYPNDYVTDDYDFTIPVGNTDTVKFYLGGDTAPGSSDQGYGIMLTEPVRSVISLNTSSKIMFGFREVSGSRSFDGATSQPFSTPYNTVQSGGDIGYVGTAYNHDAGLMMQWNLGSTPGTYEGKLQQFATRQGTNLNAAFAQTRVETGQEAVLNISVVNSELTSRSGLGYTITLPAGLTINDLVTTDCGGTIIAAVGESTITGSGISVGGAANCVVTVPVMSESPGSYTVNAASVSGLQGVLTNNVGSSTLNVGVYALSFITQGGSAVADIIAEEGDLITLPTSLRPGYALVEWNTLPGGGGTSYAPGDGMILPSYDLSLYAIWAAVPYDLTFDSQGGTAVAARNDLTYGTVLTLDIPSRDGYRFLGWNTLANGTGTTYPVGDDQSYTMPAADTVLYAQWSELYTASYETGEGSAQASVIGIAGEDFYLSDDTSREGYRLVGWSTAPNGGGTVYEVYEEYTFTTSNVTFYAVWAPVYQMTFVVFDDEESDEYVEGDMVYLPGWYYRDGYTLLGWNTERNGSGTMYELEAEIPMPAQSTRLYAVWEDNDDLSTEQENAVPGNGDGNGDGKPDSQQAYVSSFVSPLTSKPVTISASLNENEAAVECQFSNASVVASGSLASDPTYTYPVGLFDFSVSCGDPGFSATITQYYYDAPAGAFVLRKFLNGQFSTINDATIETQTINGQQVLVVTYTVVDGGELDADGEANGVVVDPAGPAYVTPPVQNADVPNTGLEQQSPVFILTAATLGAVLLAGALVIRGRGYESTSKL